MPSNPPLTPDELATLARLTTEAEESLEALVALSPDDANYFTANRRWMKASIAFDDFCTFERIARLVDAVRAGEADRARLHEALTRLHVAAVNVNDRYVGGSPLKGALGNALERLAAAEVHARLALAARTPTSTGRHADAEI